MKRTSRSLRQATRLGNAVAGVSSRAYEDRELASRQDAVTASYIERGLLLSCDVSNVEKFFSPSRVPLGLTKKQLDIVVELAPLREWQKSHLPTGSSAMNPPFDYNPDKPMSYQKFSNGIHQFYDCVLTELTIAKPFIFAKRDLNTIEGLRKIMG